MNTNQAVDNNMILLQIKIMYIFRVLRLIIIILILSYFLGTLWLLISKMLTKNKDDPDEMTFYNQYSMREKTNFTQLTIVVYFAFTTLSTVGFGDYHPKGEIERIITTFILLCGVACFSYIMGQFIEILMNFQQVTADNEDSENLSKWLGLLAHFNKNRPLSKELTKKFE
jgi:polyferredoxin